MCRRDWNRWCYRSRIQRLPGGTLWIVITWKSRFSSICTSHSHVWGITNAHISHIILMTAAVDSILIAQTLPVMVSYSEEWGCFHCSLQKNGIILDCDDCYTSESGCPVGDLCNIPGRVIGHQIDFDIAVNSEECVRQCQSVENCTFYTFDSSSNLCFLFRDASSFDTSCKSCTSGQSSCSGGKQEISLYGNKHIHYVQFFLSEEEYSVLMVVGGFPASAYNDVEIVDLSKTPRNCTKPNDYPKSSGMVGTYFPESGKIMVCGGDPPQKDCYIYNKVRNFANTVQYVLDCTISL